jgi:hypothetical protein
MTQLGSPQGERKATLVGGRCHKSANNGPITVATKGSFWFYEHL